MRSTRSTRRDEYPHSLSYQPKTFTIVPEAIVSSLSKMQEYVEPTMSCETIGSSVYWRIPSSGPPAARRNVSLTSSTLVSRPTRTTRSTIEPVETGARIAMPSTLPCSSGSTRPIARAAPVDVGMRLIAAARARRRSSCGRSRMRWSFVYAWIVVMKPRSIVNASCSTFASAATQLVVQDALETMWCRSGSYWSSFTPRTTVRSGSVAGAEMITFFAPASRCFCAPSRFVKKPVDSITTSTSRSRHGIEPGSFSERSRSSAPPAFSVPPSTETSPSSGPRFESYLSRCAIVLASPRSFAATISKSAPRSSAARKKLRPMRPKPLIATRVFAMATDSNEGAVGSARGLGSTTSQSRRTPCRTRRARTRSPSSASAARAASSTSGQAGAGRRSFSRRRSARGPAADSAGDGEPVDLAELRAQVAHVGLGVDLRRARDALERLERRELAAVTVQVVSQPLAQRPELALLELVVQVGEVGDDALPDLRGDQVPEGVRREVADRAGRPVRVLQDAARVVRHLDLEVIPHAAVPLLRELLERERLGEHLLLELEAEDDVEVVRRLVGLDPDERRLDGVHLAIPPIGVVAGERVGEVLLEAREEVAPEGERTPDEVLPHAALRLVHPERRAAREQRALERLVDLMLVQPVAGLVHRREEAVEVVLEVARRDPDVVDRAPRGERVHRRIEPPRRLFEPEALDHLALEHLLRLDRERPAARDLAVPAGARDLLHERRLVLLHVVEELAHLGRFHVALEVVE